MSERLPAGFVWMELARRQMEAVRKENMERVAELHALMNGIEREFPEAVAIETKLWGPTENGTPTP